MRYFIEHSYHGARYCGWQIQSNGITVQQVLEEKLKILIGEPIRLIGSSRTDSGVHAAQQFAHFDTSHPIDDRSDLTYRLNAVLPHDVAVTDIRPVADAAHSRFDATHRTYCYRVVRRKSPLLLGLAYDFRRSLDFKKMNQAAAFLSEHADFECFSKIHTDVKHFECVISLAQWIKVTPELWEFHIRSNRFLRGMVRAVVGTLLEVGEGKRSVESFQELILGKDRKKAGPQAPPHGLYLMEVGYAENIFSVSENR